MKAPVIDQILSMVCLSGLLFVHGILPAAASQRGPGTIAATVDQPRGAYAGPCRLDGDGNVVVRTAMPGSDGIINIVDWIIGPSRSEHAEFRNWIEQQNNDGMSAECYWPARS